MYCLLFCYLTLVVKLGTAQTLTDDEILTKFKTLELKLEDSNKKLAETTKELSELKKHTAYHGAGNKKQILESPVAFTAQLSKHAEHLGVLQTIIFDYVLTNLGAGYNNTTGIFTCPMNGAYVFSATIMSYYNDYIETRLAVNGVLKASDYAGGSGRFNQGTTLAVLKRGDTVWLQTVGNPAISHVYGEYWSSFMGFLVN